MSMTKPASAISVVHNIDRVSDADWLTMLQINHCIVRLFNSETIEVEYPDEVTFDGIEEWLERRKMMVSE